MSEQTGTNESDTREDAMLNDVLRAAEANRETDLADLLRLVAQPSISAQDIGVRECAGLELALLEAAGLESRLIETPRHPMVCGQWLNAPGKPTIFFYGDYDVQPPDPLDLWETPPFEPTTLLRVVAPSQRHGLISSISTPDVPEKRSFGTGHPVSSRRSRLVQHWSKLTRCNRGSQPKPQRFLGLIGNRMHRSKVKP